MGWTSEGPSLATSSVPSDELESAGSEGAAGNEAFSATVGGTTPAVFLCVRYTCFLYAQLRRNDAGQLPMPQTTRKSASQLCTLMWLTTRLTDVPRNAHLGQLTNIFNTSLTLLEKMQGSTQCPRHENRTGTSVICTPLAQFPCTHISRASQV